LRLAKLAGASPIYAFDCFPWRAQKALEWGATGAWTPDDGDFVEIVREKTGGRGVDIAYEVAWADHSVQQAAEMARHGGRVMLVGIPSDDRLQMQHSVARRKGLTLVMVRRMKHTYPRAIHLAMSGKTVIDLEGLISHHFPLDEAGTAFEVNASYHEGVHKVIIDMP
jgi:L-iditol 2-dehydrogenase